MPAPAIECTTLCESTPPDRRHVSTTVEGIYMDQTAHSKRYCGDNVCLQAVCVVCFGLVKIHDKQVPNSGADVEPKRVNLAVEERIWVQMSCNEAPCCHQRKPNIHQKNSDRHASGRLHHSVDEKGLGAKTVQTRNNAKLLFISVIPH